MRKLIAVVCMVGACLPLLGAEAAAAQAHPAETSSAEPERRALPIEKRVAVELITGAIEHGAASEAGTGTRAYGMQLHLGLKAFRALTVGTDLGLMDISDERPFAQETTSGAMASNVTAGMGTVTVGLRSPWLGLGGKDPATLSVNAGVGHTYLYVNRSILNCSDCHTEDVGIRAGNFLETGLEVIPGRRWGISAKFRKYHGGSHLQDAVIIGGTWEY